MATIRSKFSLDQFELVLQQLAHKIAIDAVTTLERGDVRISIHGSRISDVETSKHSIRFYAKHIGYTEKSTRTSSYWGFDVEEKFYITSNHCSKISFWAPEDKMEKAEKQIMAFIEKLMAEASITPIPRFSLKDYVARAN